MELGAFSISLTVADLAASKDFYQALGFQPVEGAGGDDWQILRNGQCTLGLFQGMFPKNMLTFNPGWVSETETQDPFTDIREIQSQLRSAGIEPQRAIDPGGTGPDSLTVFDPDGNPVFIDQHRDKPSA